MIEANMPLQGRPDPLGLTFSGAAANFALWAGCASQVSLCLFDSTYSLIAEIPMHGPQNGVWHIELENYPMDACYLYRIDGKDLVSDPYSKAFSNHYLWGDFSLARPPFYCPLKEEAPFDWQEVASPNIPLNELIIYEMHVRGFTAHSSSQVRQKGTFLGVIEKIPYLKELGVNAVELMPIFEFDETHATKVYSDKLHPRINYWGYNPISFFMPMSRYASRPGNALVECKTMIRELHRAGIEVLLDVVYNHTGEGIDYTVSFRGIDRPAYYMLDHQGNDVNYSGCGNTFQANTDAARRLIIDSLSYWVREMHVDGFRFDLGAALTRSPDGRPLESPPILADIAKEPLFQKVKLIAEPWDAAGLNQVGQFPKWGRWSEWNGFFRDHVRKFIKGTDNETGAFAAALCGSEPTFGYSKTPSSSINFITAHDGFTLRDLVSYQNKHNIENGENNRDGADQNYSWNCGDEGPTQNEEIHELRERQMRNFWLALMLSQGIPMILMGDEMGHTRKGNNNPYVQDNDINWLNWANHHSMLNFVSALLRFRKLCPLLHRSRFITPSDIEWHGHVPHHPDWKVHSRFIAFSMQGGTPLYAAFNADFSPAAIFPPPAPVGKCWRIAVYTADPWDRHHLDHPEKGPETGSSIEMLPHSALLLQAHDI